jgi:DNA-binding MarR family transcriptional regulator
MPAAHAANRDAVLAQFNRNLPRHLSGVSQALNELLIQQGAAVGHGGLKTAFTPVLMRCGAEGMRSVDIAKSCGITPQAAGQIANELEQLGYLKRKPDNDDRRAKRLVLTAKGRKWLQDAARLSADSAAQLSAVIGAEALAELRQSSADLYRELVDAPAPPAVAADSPHYLSMCLTALATYCEQELMELDKGAGHLRLKMSFSKVISPISPYGSLISELARINGVSKQAISQVVKEVEELGYVERQHNPGDARSSKLFLTAYGLQLIEDSLTNIGVLEQRFIAVLREKRFRRFADALEQLYDYFFIASNKLLDASQRARSEAALQHFMESLYREKSPDEAALLFTRSGNKLRFSNTALKILTELELRIDA